MCTEHYVNKKKKKEKIKEIVIQIYQVRNFISRFHIKTCIKFIFNMKYFLLISIEISVLCHKMSIKFFCVTDNIQHNCYAVSKTFKYLISFHSQQTHNLHSTTYTQIYISTLYHSASMLYIASSKVKIILLNMIYRVVPLYTV